MSTIWDWLVQTLTSTITAIAHNLVFYILAVPVVGFIAWLTLPHFKPPFDDEDQGSD
jgi:hypothetical protein